MKLNNLLYLYSLYSFVTSCTPTNSGALPFAQLGINIDPHCIRSSECSYVAYM